MFAVLFSVFLSLSPAHIKAVDSLDIQRHSTHQTEQKYNGQGKRCQTPQMSSEDKEMSRDEFICTAPLLPGNSVKQAKPNIRTGGPQVQVPGKPILQIRF